LCRAVLPVVVAALMAAPEARRREVSAAWPFEAEGGRGVRPVVVRAEASAPLSRRRWARGSAAVVGWRLRHLWRGPWPVLVAAWRLARAGGGVGVGGVAG